MTAFSSEPPRRDCLLYISFDTYDEGLERYVDESPQGHDATISSGSIGTTAGVVGQAGVFDDDSQLEVNSVDGDRDYAQLTVSSWHQPERPIDAATQNVEFTATFPSGEEKITHTVGEDVDGWQFAVGLFDGDTMHLYYAQRGETLVKVGHTSTPGGEDVDGAFSLTWSVNGESYLDEARIYDTDLSADHIANLYEMGLPRVGEVRLTSAWDNAGIPFQGSNIDLATTLAGAQNQYFRDLDALLDGRHIDSAGGQQLDRLGRVGGIARKTDESDEKYRARIKGILAAGRSRGTFSDVLEAGARILDTEKERIFIDADYDTKPGHIYIYVREEDLDDSKLTTSDLDSIFDKTVAAGHRVTIVERGANPFTVTDDSTANDPDQGLTSDSIATGGGLVSDT